MKSKKYDHSKIEKKWPARHASRILRGVAGGQKEYDHKKIESKWQKFWLKEKLFDAESPRSSASSPRQSAGKPKFYGLIEFPYPSGDGLHVGHVRSNTAMDIISRKRRMEGYNVLYPIGWDAFGLPTENYAIKTGIQPAKVTKTNTDIFRRQLQSLGFSFDWSREINTTDPKYYKWTQWIFSQMFKAGLAYKKKMLVNWCPKDKIVLANEEVQVGCCERCGTPVEKREKEQWMLAITKYADRLDKDLDDVDYLPQIKIQQRNWIGKSEGSLISFATRTNADFTRTNAEEKKEIRSYLMGVENIDSNLKDISVKIIEKTNDGNYKIIIPTEKINDYEKLISEKLQPGFWNEYISDKVVFIFKDKFGKINRIVWNELNEQELLDLCNEYAKPSKKFTSIKKMLENNDWYSSLQPSASSPRQSATSITIDVFTTRADTLFGATYLVLAPEHPIIENCKLKIENWNEVEKYIKETKNKSDIDRTDIKKEKTGIKLHGMTAINPANNEEIPIWIADYVLGDYGTGAIMAVPAHDERDFEFAKKYNLTVKQVIAPHVVDTINPPQKGKKETERIVIHALVKHPNEDKFISLHWKKFPWKTFITGGVEDGEDIIEAAKREVHEETGYKNLKFIKKLPYTIFAQFFAAHKDVNRNVFAHFIYFELENLKKDEISEEEKQIHDIVWTPIKEMHTLGPVSELEHVIKWLKDGDGAYTDLGILLNSGKFDGLNSDDAKKKITEFVGGKIVTTYKLRDWVFSRQRYWGEPIPIIYCSKCLENLKFKISNLKLEEGRDFVKINGIEYAIVPLPDDDLPVELPKVENYQPTDNGESPLAGISKWVNVKCPQCGSDAKRETDTMPQWAGSSWYYLAYLFDRKGFENMTSIENWKLEIENFRHFMPVDWYNGGMEHTTLHLLYSRFWHKFLYDQKLVPTSEPYKKRTSHGLILALGGEKMSKSKGNVVNPDEIVKTWGADSLRLYEMFMGPFDQSVSWNVDNIIGVRRFLERIWQLQELVMRTPRGLTRKDSNKNLSALLNKTVQKVTEDIEAMKFNTAISAMMILVNEMSTSVGEEDTEASKPNAGKTIQKEDFEIFLKLLSPFAPHICEEIWSSFGHKKSIILELWPTVDISKIEEKDVNIVVQINGKVRGQVVMPVDSQQSVVISKIKEDKNIEKWLTKSEPKKIIYIKNKLINIVI